MPLDPPVVVNVVVVERIPATENLRTEICNDDDDDDEDLAAIIGGGRNGDTGAPCHCESINPMGVAWKESGQNSAVPPPPPPWAEAYLGGDVLLLYSGGDMCFETGNEDTRLRISARRDIFDTKIVCRCNYIHRHIYIFTLA